MRSMGLLLLALVLSFVPAFCYATLIFWLDRYEREPKLLLVGVFAWGAVISVIQALIVSATLQGGVLWLTHSEQLADVAGTTLIAPVVEECTKGLAILVIFFAARQEFDSILDGIVYASVVALGFAATENVLYLSQAGAEGGMGDLFVLFGIRVLLGGWGHAVYTAWTGIGFAVARLSPNRAVKVLAPLLGLVVAICVHAAFNATLTFTDGSLISFAAFGIDWLGWLVLLGVIVWATARETRWMSTYLADEVQNELLTPQQFRVACSAWAKTGAIGRALFSGRYQPTSRFYQLCGELAQKKYQQGRFGEEGNTAATIALLRTELSTLSPRAIV